MQAEEIGLLLKQERGQFLEFISAHEYRRGGKCGSRSHDVVSFRAGRAANLDSKLFRAVAETAAVLDKAQTLDRELSEPVLVTQASELGGPVLARRHGLDGTRVDPVGGEPARGADRGCNLRDPEEEGTLFSSVPSLEST